MSGFHLNPPHNPDVTATPIPNNGDEIYPCPEQVVTQPSREGDPSATTTEAVMPEEQGSEQSRELEERRRKNRIRRERNRASARRSNLKRKENRERLIEEVRSSKERLEVLRVREMELRRENLRLKDILERTRRRGEGL